MDNGNALKYLRRSSGFTVLEILVVISITALLASLMYPVFRSVVWQAKLAKSLSQLRQIHVALAQYVAEQPDDGPLGLGLPPDVKTLYRAQNLPRDLFWTGGSNWKDPSNPAVYTWMPPICPALVPGQEEYLEKWLEYVEMTNRNPVVFLDETFSPNASTFSQKTGYGLFFDGHIEKRRTWGSLSQLELWR